MRPAAALLAAGLVLGALGGCSSFSPREAARSRNLDVAYQPVPGDAAFRALALEKTPSVVVLKIDGDDIGSNMEIVSHALLAKGYLVRDFHVTLRELSRADLLSRDLLDPDALEKVSKLFTEAAAVAGSVEVLQLEPLRLRIRLSWIDLRARKTLWTVKAAYSAYVFGGRGRFEETVRDAVAQALSPLPAAKP